MNTGDGTGLDDWLRTPLGRSLLEAELGSLERVLPRLFGYYLLQLGCEEWPQQLGSSPIRNHVVLGREGRAGSAAPVIAGEASNLPVASATIDVVALLHLLEFDRQPHEVLREAYRVLVPEGRVVITMFNPVGLWGLRQVLSNPSRAPWDGRFLSLMRLRDWLALLGFELDRVERFYYRPPLQHDAMMEKTKFLESWGCRWWPGLSGAYLVVARKRVIPLTPVRPRWRARRGMLPTGAIEPSARSMKFDQGS